MSEISLRLMWLVVQVTLVSAGATILLAIFHRWKNVATAGLLRTALLLVLVLTVVSPSPWPTWATFRTSELQVVMARPVGDLSTVDATHTLRTTDNLASQEPPHSPDVWFASLKRWTNLVLATAPVDSRIILPLLGLFLLLGSMRFLIGWWAIRKLLRESKVIDDRCCHEMLEALNRNGNFQGVVVSRTAILEHAGITTPATMGWRNPVILLPADWRGWRADELQAVLAHEAAHISRNDFATLCVAQLIALFHFYHPLVHGLVSSLRLEQELAADAAAAELTGGRQRYMASLASLALRTDSQPVVWPLRCFLPARGTFLRRIEMLKNPLTRTPIRSNWVASLNLLAIVALGLVAAGLRPIAVQAQVETKPANAVATDDQPNEEELMIRRFDNLRSIGRALHNYLAKNDHFPAAVIAGPGGVEHSWRVAILPELGYQDIYEKYKLDEPWDSPSNKKLLKMIPKVYQAYGADKKSANTSYFAIVGEGTGFARTGEGLVISSFTDGTVNTLLVVESKRDVPWTKPEDIDYVQDKPLPNLGGIHEGGFAGVFADGAGHFITDQVDKETLKNVILRGDNNIVDFGKLHPDASTTEAR